MAVFVIFVIDVKLIFGGGLGCTAVGSAQILCTDICCTKFVNHREKSGNLKQAKLQG